MKRKILIILLTLTLVGCSIVGLTACGNSEEPPHEHSYSTEWTKTDSHHYYACSCGEKQDYNEHTFDDGREILAPTETEKGEKLFTCSTCNFTKIEEISATGTTPNNPSTPEKPDHTHDHKAQITEPKCGKQGYTTYTCECGDSYVSDYVKALEHKYTNYTYNNDAKCGINGTETASCNRNCGEKHTREKINTALIHSFTKYYSDKNATYEKDGTKTALCDHGCGLTDTIDDVGSMLVENEIRFNTLSVDGTDVYGKVSNKTETFSFIDEVLAVGVAKFVVSLDIYGMKPVATKTIPLTIGDNKVYVIEMIDGEPTNVYEVIVRRRPMYTVSFNTNGGTSVASQQVEEDSFVIEPYTSKLGYDFLSWDHSFDSPVLNNLIISANFKVKDEMNNFDFVSTGNSCHIKGLKDESISCVVLPKYITKISCEFYNCTNLNSVNFNGTIEDWLKIDFMYQSSNPLTRAKDFYINNQLIKKITIPNTVKIIKNFAFLGIENIDEIIIPSSVKEIQTFCFSYYESFNDSVIVKYNGDLEEWIKINRDNDANIFVDYIGDKNILEYTDITIPETIVEISADTFAGFKNLEKISIPNNILRVGSGAFKGCDKLNFYEKNNIKYLGNKTNNFLIAIKAIDDTVNSIKIEDACRIIYPSAFSYCTKISDIEIPENIVCIGEFAFSQCHNLKDITLKCDSISYIGKGAIGLSSMTSNSLFTSKNGITYLGTVNNPYLIAYGIGKGNVIVQEGCKIILDNSPSADTIKISNSVVCISALFKGIITYDGTVEDWYKIYGNNKCIELNSSIEYIQCSNGIVEICSKFPSGGY